MWLSWRISSFTTSPSFLSKTWFEQKVYKNGEHSSSAQCIPLRFITLLLTDNDGTSSYCLDSRQNFCLEWTKSESLLRLPPVSSVGSQAILRIMLQRASGLWASRVLEWTLWKSRNSNENRAWRPCRDKRSGFQCFCFLYDWSLRNRKCEEKMSMYSKHN